MAKHRYLVSLLFLALGWIQTPPTHADSWHLPGPRFYVSPGGDVAVRIVPRGVSSQLHYFQDLVDGQENPGLPEGCTLEQPQAEIYRKNRSGSLDLKHTFQLVNPVSPVSALISDDGRFLVTFDNWHSMGHGDHVVVIYQTDGTLIRSMTLADLLTERDLIQLPRSVSSIWWSGQHVIDADDLVLRVTTCTRGDSRCQDPPADLRIDLATGQPRAEKKHLRPYWDLDVHLSHDAPPASETATETTSTPPDSQCRKGHSKATFQEAEPTPLAALLPSDPLSLPPPTGLAIHVKLEGTTHWELLVAPDGRVVCVRPWKSLGLGLKTAAAETLLSWKLNEVSPESPLRKAFVTITYEGILRPPAD